MQSFWMPKKQPLYAPMLSTFGGGSIRGFRGSGGGGSGTLDITLASAPRTSSNWWQGSNLIANHYSAFTFGATDSGHFSSSSQFSLPNSNSGIFTFTMPAGSYNYEIKGGRGNSGPEPTTYYGAISFTSDTDVLFLGGLHGKGSYGGGGGTFFALGTHYQSVTSGDALLVAGGTASAYGAFHVGMRNGIMHNNTSDASTRIGVNSGNLRNYDDGAGFINSYTPSQYSGTRPQHFVQGGDGHPQSSCGSSWGGFGGAGGGCPGGGGGYVGGYAGGDGTTGGGSAGTSYYNTVYATHTGTNSPNNGGNTGNTYNSFQRAECGFLRLYGTIS